MSWKNKLFYLLPPLLALTVFLSVNFKTDLSAFILAGDNAEEILLASEMQSGSLSRRYLISISSAKNDETPVSPAIAETFKNSLQRIPGVTEVWLPGQQNNLSQAVQTLYGQYGAGLYSLNAEQDLAQLFTAEGLQQRATLLKNVLLSPQAAMFKKMVVQDPLLLSLNSFKSAAGQMQTLKQNMHYQNLILQTEAAGLNAAEQSRIQQQIKRVFKQLNQTLSGRYQLEMTGVPVFAVATQQLIQGDITKVSIISTIALILLFLLIFRSVRVMFQVFSLLIIVILSSILCTQLLFGYVHGMTVAIGSTLVGICIDYPIHAVAHAQAVDSQQRVAVISRVWPSMLLGGLTTMIGYTALGISGYPGFQQVAVYAGSGIIISLLLTRFVFPGLIAGIKCRQLNVPLVASWALFCQRFRPALLLLIVGLLAAALFSFSSLRWMEDMQQLTPELDYLKKNDQRIRARLTSIEPGRFVLISGQNTEAALQRAEQVYPLLEQLKQQGALKDYFGFYPWLLSAHKQQHNQRYLQRYLTDENRLLWQQALKQQGLSVKHLGNLAYNNQATISLDQVLISPVGKLLDSRIIVGSEQTLLMIWLSKHQPEQVKTALQALPGVQYFSQRDMLNAMTRDYTERAKVLLSMGLAVIVLILVIRFKSLVKALQTLLPSMLAALFILTIWSFTGTAISFLHLVGFLLVIAICVDYGIFYQENRGDDIRLTYQAMTASMLTSALAFGSLMVAESAALKVLSLVVALGVILGFIFCPLIINTKRPVA